MGWLELSSGSLASYHLSCLTTRAFWGHSGLGDSLGSLKVLWVTVGWCWTVLLQPVPACVPQFLF